MKKVLLLSASFGDGHRQVAHALAEELSASNIEVVTVDTFRSTNRKAARLNEKLYEHLTSHFPGLYGLSYYATARLAPNHWLWKGLAFLSRKAAWTAIKEHEPDIVLQLFPDHSLRTLPRQLKKKPLVGVVLTDYASHSRWYHSGVDFYCFPHAVTAEYAERWITENQQVHITGIPLRSQFATFISGQKELTQASPYVVVATGGRGVFPDLYQVIHEIRMVCPHMQVKVLCGRNPQILNLVRKIGEGDPFVEGIPFTDDIARLYNNAAFSVVKAGGITVAECHACLCPMIFYKPLSGQEKVNATMCEQLGTGVAAKNIKAFRNCLRDLSDSRLARMKQFCAGVARPNAAKEVTQVILCIHDTGTKKRKENSD